MAGIHRLDSSFQACVKCGMTSEDIGRSGSMECPARLVPTPPGNLHTVLMTVEEAGQFLRNMAELTARGSQNWNNYQSIATGVVRDAVAHGKAQARKERT